ncbi:unnamed protein product [Caenorhabditis auriculariae]|uniref:Uncharacterized protein n=1 Tax=Caenorhabditis auriculariae TaxID=2777116 RepID=A0A8S1H4R3_9PELO|nr:unnamed protein product [Caenorhabditis auriculariae]
MAARVAALSCSFRCQSAQGRIGNWQHDGGGGCAAAAGGSGKGKGKPTSGKKTAPLEGEEGKSPRRGFTQRLLSSFATVTHTATTTAISSRELKLLSGQES